jgi:type III secretion protein W
MVDPIRGVSQSEVRSANRKHEALQSAKALDAAQVESQEDSMQAMETAIYSPMEQQKKFKELKQRSTTETTDVPKEGEESEASQKAQQAQKKNPELSARTLLAVKENLSEKDSASTLLGKMREAYPDPALADEALDYMIETSGNNKELLKNLKTAKEQFNTDFGREIRSGRNIQSEAQTFAKEGLGSPTALRDLYRDITGNPREPITLFDELSGKFSFQELIKVVSFMMHSLGADMKAKGPSISMPELQRLFTETRTMQAIVGVYRFFQSRMSLVEGEFNRNDLTLPGRLNFEQLAKVFMKFIQDRYPSVSKVYSLAALLGISEELEAQIVIFMQYRDAMRNISPRLFKSDKHRQGLLMTFIETLSELDDIEDEEEGDGQEEDEDLEEEKKRGKHRYKDSIG